MTTSRLTPPPAAAAVAVPRAPQWRDAAWLTWCQHRAALLVSAVVATALTAVTVLLGNHVHTLDGCADGASAAFDSPHRQCLLEAQSTAGHLAAAMQTGTWLTLALGLFWGAPLISREFETGTVAIAWGQDMTPTRWLVGRFAFLLIIAWTLTGVVAAGAKSSFTRVFPGASEMLRNRFKPTVFQSDLLPMLGYTTLALALGVAMSAFLRRTLPAMALTAFTYFVVRAVLGAKRSGYLEPESTTVRFGTDAPRLHGGLIVSGNSTRTRPYLTTYRFQPASRLHLFEVIETGICLALAVLLLAATLVVIRCRQSGVTPTHDVLTSAATEGVV